MSTTINLTTKYSKAVQEHYKIAGVTSGSFSKDLDMEFVGYKTVRTYDLELAELNDYVRSGTSRYGTPTEIGDTIQEYQMTQDKSFTKTIDKGNAMEQMNIKQAGAWLRRESDEVIMPLIDRYRLKVWAENAGIVMGASSAPTKATIAGMIMDLTAEMDDQSVPAENRILYIPAKSYKLLKLCPEFTGLEGLGVKSIAKGQIGEFDGMEVRKVPSVQMPANVYFMIVRKDAAISPVKLQDFKIHKDPMGVSGEVIEGRVMFDAFVRGTKANGIAVCAAAAYVCKDPTITIASNAATIASDTEDAVIVYTTDGSDPRYSTSAKTYSSTSKPTLTAGETIKAAATKSGLYHSNLVTAKNA